MSEKFEQKSTRSKCCLCGAELDGFGNNPWPLAASDARCCDWCNDTVVIPERIWILTKRHEEEQKNGQAF